MQRSENKVTGQGSLNGDLSRLQITGFADEDAVWVLTKEGTKAAGEGEADALVDRYLHDALDIVLHGIFRGEKLGVGRIDLSQASVEGGGFSRTSRTGHDDDSVG